jgi:predicted nucleic acid-binding protein
VSYWDTSALLKLYVSEADSLAFVGMAAMAPKMISAFIGKHEARTAMRRREAEGVLVTGGGVACYQKLIEDVVAGRIELIAESAALEQEFGQMLNQCLSQSPPVFIRTNDALHLAAARLANEREFVSADRHQRVAAAFLGFTVLPAIYPIPV